jgi:hypothetical protein
MAKVIWTTEIAPLACHVVQHARGKLWMLLQNRSNPGHEGIELRATSDDPILSFPYRF